MTDDENLTRAQWWGISIVWLSALFFWLLGVVTFIGWVF